MSGSSSERKSKPATQQKLRRSRKDGEVAQSQKAITLLSVSILLGALMMLFGSVQFALSELLTKIFPMIGRPIQQSWPQVWQDVIKALVVSAGPFLALAVGVATLGTIAYHRGIPFSLKPIVPNFSRLSVSQGFKRMFGRRTWVETSVGLLQLFIWGAIVWYLVDSQKRNLFGIYNCGLPCMEGVATELLRGIAVAAIVLFMLLLSIEVVLQQALYKSDQKMTKTEYKREQKDQHGSPEVRKARNQQRYVDRFFDSVDRSVIGVGMANMCFFSKAGAVGIRYHPEIAPIPFICALAVGADAKALRDEVRQNGFPEGRSAKIVEACLRRPEGTPAPESIHPQLAAAISAMFS